VRGETRIGKTRSLRYGRDDRKFKCAEHNLRFMAFPSNQEHPVLYAYG